MKNILIIKAEGLRNRDGVIKYFNLICDFAGGVQNNEFWGYKFIDNSGIWVFHLWSK